MNKSDLIHKLNSLEGITNDERAYLINLVNTKKKYGLVWEEKPEDVEELLRENLPVLREVVEKRILSKDLPVLEKKESTLLDGLEQEEIPTCPNHILIEGDNLHALTALMFTHEGKIDVMYFDPPYNTGNKDFKYNDSFVDQEDTYRHSKWLSFMHKRLAIAKRLLSEKGVILISINDKEQAQLKLLCDEIFGEDNILAKFVWRTDGNFDNQAQIKNCHEYILAYCLHGDTFKIGSTIDPNVHDDSKLFKENIQNTIVKNGHKNPVSEVILPPGFPCLFEQGLIKKRDNKYPHFLSDVEVKNYKTINQIVVKSGWSSRALLELFIKNDFLPVIDTKNQQTEFRISETGSIEAIKTRTDQSHVISVLMNMGNTQSNSNKLLDMGIKFSYPKPITLICYLLKIIPNKSVKILDIFAGSGTTLHASMLLNSEDKGNRQCILATNNENNICEEVTYVRNYKVIQGYTNLKGETFPGLTNNNLRYYKCDFVPRESSIKSKKQLTKSATDLLSIKENCYTDCTTQFQPGNQSWIKLLTDDISQFLCIIYDDDKIEETVLILKQLIDKKQPERPVKVYVFSNGQYPYTEEFEDILPHITLCALPDAIYKAYQNVLPSKKRVRLLEFEEFNNGTTIPSQQVVVENDLFNQEG